MIRRWVIYALVLCGGALFYIFFKGWFSFFTLLALLAAPVLSLLLAMPSIRGVKPLLRASAPVARRGEPFSFSVEFRGKSLLPLAKASVTLEIRNALDLPGKHRKKNRKRPEKPVRCVIPLNGKYGQTVSRTLSSSCCGKIICTATKLRCYDCLGLFPFPRGKAQTAQVFVPPEPVPVLAELTQAALPSPEGSLYSPYKPGDDSSQIFGTRPYREGDLLRAVHWKLSSKTDSLMVREFSLPMESAVTVLLDTAGGLPQLDLLMDTLSSLCGFLLENGVHHRVVFFGGNPAALQTRYLAEEENLPLLLNELLSGRNSMEGATLACYVKEPLPGQSRLLYLTAMLSDGAAQLLALLDNCRVTVLLAESSATVVPEEQIFLQSGKLPQCLQGLSI